MEAVVRRLSFAFRQSPELAWGLVVALLLSIWRSYQYIVATWHYYPDFIRDYQGIWYFVDYRSGFVRRGFVGESVRLAGLNTEQAETVFRIGVVLTALAVVGLIALALAVAVRGRTAISGYAAAVLLLTSPLFVALPIHDLARLDSVGIICGVLILVLVVPRRIPIPVGVFCSLILLIVATATEELLLLYLLPIVLSGLGARLLLGGERRWIAYFGWSLLAVVPAAIVFVMSYLHPVTKASAEIIVLKTGGPLWEGCLGSPAWSLTQTTSDGRAFVDTFPDHSKTVILAFLAFLLVAIALHLLLRPPTVTLLVGAYVVAVSLALGVVAVDVQRWWGLALMAFASCCVALARVRPLNETEREATYPTRMLIGLTVAGSLVFALTPAFPKMAAGFAGWSDLAWRTLFGY